MKKKECKKCGDIKAMSEFYKERTNKDGLRGSCKDCERESSKRKRRTVKGLVNSIYHHQKEHSLSRVHPLPNYSKEELYLWVIAQSNFQKLYSNWANGGYIRKQIPSVDRIDDYKHYSLDNIQLMTFAENEAKNHKDRREGINNKMNTAVIQRSISGEFIDRFNSMHIAERSLKIQSANIWKVCAGRDGRKTAGGFKWEYAEPKQ